MAVHKESRWDYFDQTVTRSLSSSTKNSIITTQILYETSSFTPHVVRSCKNKYVSHNQRRIVEFAETSKLFIRTHFSFSLGDTFYVGSQVADMCLADIIPCTLKIAEVHAASIIKQVCFLV